MRVATIILALGPFLGGCGVPPRVEGPAPPLIGEVASIAVTDLRAGARAAEITHDTARIERFLVSEAWLFSSTWFAESPAALPPALRIDLNTNDGRTRSYWMGYWADANQPPCYRFCSGAWFAPSSVAGKPDSTRRKLFTSSALFRLQGDLETLHAGGRR